jgi:hypothetical protein
MIVLPPITTNNGGSDLFDCHIVDNWEEHGEVPPCHYHDACKNHLVNVSHTDEPIAGPEMPTTIIAIASPDRGPGTSAAGNRT